jgi:urate oxidase
MLTKKDLNQIEEITQRVVQKSISEAFLDFYDHIFGPFVEKTEERFERNDRQHKEIVAEFHKNDIQHNEITTELRNINDKIEEVKEYIKDHEKRIKNLEAISIVKI